MAKCKFTDARITEIIATLDVDEENNYIVVLEDESFPLEDILKAHVGDFLQLKFTRDM